MANMRSLNPAFLFGPTVRVALSASHRGLTTVVLFARLPSPMSKTSSFAERQFVAFATSVNHCITSITPSMLHAMIGAAMCSFWTIFRLATLATAMAYAFPAGLCIPTETRSLLAFPLVCFGFDSL